MLEVFLSCMKYMFLLYIPTGKTNGEKRGILKPMGWIYLQMIHNENSKWVKNKIWEMKDRKGNENCRE